MLINDIIRRYRPVFEEAGESGNGTGGDTGGDADNGGEGGDDNSANSPDAVLSANPAPKTGDEDADAGNASDDAGGDAGDKSDKDDANSDDKEKGDGKTGDDNDPDAVPEGEYAFEMPEGMELDKGMADAMSPLFKEIGITQSQANQLVAAYGEQIKDGAEAEAQVFVDRITGWTDAAKSDPEIGNDNWDATVAAGNAALQKFGTPELTQALGETGMSNHPEMIRFMTRVAKAVGSDNFEPGDNVDTGDTPTEVSWYGATTPTTKKG